MADSINWSLIYHALIMIGCVPVLISSLVSVKNIELVAKKVDCDTILTDENIINDITISNCIKVQDLDWSFASLFDNFYDYQPNDYFFMTATSGTTGLAPKIILHKHDHVEQNMLANLVNFTTQDVICCPVKMCLSYGLIFNAHGLLVIGYKVVLVDIPEDIKRFHKIINQNQVTFVIGTTFLARMLVKYKNIKFGLHLKTFYAAGELITSELIQQFKDNFGLDLGCLYGQNEIHNWATMLDLIYGCSPGTLGKPVKGIVCRLIDDDGREVPQGEVGQLIIRHSSMAIGYYNLEEETSKQFQNGWYYTKDLMYCDKDGNYHLVGRTDQYVKINNCFVSAVEIEEELIKLPEIVDSTVVFDKDKNGTNISVAFVVPDQSTANINSANIRSSLLKQDVPAHRVPKNLYIVNYLPLTDTNKKIRSLEKLKKYIV
jgi:acyl-coenzyme A synthetase/AMP-(fatty) acid ligase